MTKVCEHELKKGVEYDLYARLGMTLAYHRIKKLFVIKKISDDQIRYRFERLEDAVRKCNELEGTNNTEVGCNSFCSERTRGVM